MVIYPNQEQGRAVGAANNASPIAFGSESWHPGVDQKACTYEPPTENPATLSGSRVQRFIPDQNGLSGKSKASAFSGVTRTEPMMKSPETGAAET